MYATDAPHVRPMDRLSVALPVTVNAVDLPVRATDFGSPFFEIAVPTTRLTT